MKFFYAAVGLAGAFLAGSANATPGPGLLPGNAIFSSFVTNVFDNNSVALHAPISGTQGGSPAAQEFYVPAATTITSLSFGLAETAGTSTGSLLVYLVQNGSNNLPSSSGMTLTNDVLLGSLSEVGLTTTPSIVSLSVSGGAGSIATSGDYWIALVSTSTTDPTVWERVGDTIGLDLGNAGDSDAGLYNAHATSAGALTSVNNSAFELQINTPEPASLALLGAGMAGLGFVRRRQSRKTDKSLPKA